MIKQHKTQLATLCYVTQKNKTLLLHRIKKKNDVHEGKWNGLGGKFEPGESPEDCVKREIKEEAGLALIAPKLRGVLSFPQFTEGTDWVVFVFTCSSWSGKVRPSNEGHLEWIENKKIPQLPMWPGDRYFLKWLKGKKFFSGKIEYKKKKLFKVSVQFY